MEFFKRLFGGGAPRPAGDAAGEYFYIHLDGCDEMVRVRIDRNNDLSLADDNQTLFVRKSVRGKSYKCRPAELEATFDANRRLQQIQVTGGRLVTQAEYDAWQAQPPAE